MSERVKDKVKEAQKFIHRANVSTPDHAGIQAIAGLDTALEALSTLSAEVDTLQRQIENHTNARIHLPETEEYRKVVKDLAALQRDFSHHRHVAAGDLFYRDPADPTVGPALMAKRDEARERRDRALETAAMALKERDAERAARGAAEKKVEDLRAVHREVIAELNKAGPEIADLATLDLTAAVLALRERERRTKAAVALADALRKFLADNDGKWTPGIKAINGLVTALVAFESDK